MKKKLLTSLMVTVFWQPVSAQKLPAIDVVAQPDSQAPQKVSKQTIVNQSGAKGDLVGILTQAPGVTMNPAGGLSGFPVIRGLADHRLDVQVDGMPLMSSCPNHMNTPLSYISPCQAEAVDIYPGITPVSVGGDSIGGSIVVKTKEPLFAAQDQQVTEGELGAVYRSNGQAKEGHLSVTTASDQLSLTYKGNYAQSENHQAADDFKTFTTTTKAESGTEFTSGTEGTTTKKNEVAGSAYESINHNLNIAYKGDDSLLSLTLINQTTPYQQYPNQRMDMTQNDSNKVNLALNKMMQWGELTLQGYTEQVTHKMAFMDYKTSKQMPMATDSKTQGLKLSTIMSATASSDLNMGAEIQQYRLDDYWDPNPSAAGMSPGTFQNINGGERDRYSLFAEWTNQLDRQWKTTVGTRYEMVKTHAGDVNGYHDTDSFMMGTKVTNEASEAAAFNGADRAKTDHNLNINVLSSYEANEQFDMDFGLARQVRSPDLYERYTWSTWSMAALMNNFAGDGNGYLGDMDLKPETAYTLSANFDWHSPKQPAWGLQVMPYVSQVENYIDATLVKNYGDFSVLKYANQSARLYGLDLAAHYQLAENKAGNWVMKLDVNYTKGDNLDSKDGLYNMMPLNGKLTLSQHLNVWNNAIEVVMVDDKNDVSTLRNELKTAGYTLVNLRSRYQWQSVRLDFGAENLFDVSYQLPTGGAYTGEGNTMSVTGVPLLSIPGKGRNLYVGVNVQF